MKYTIDVIIVNYNSTHVAIRCIDSIKQSIGFIQSRIIVVDNCSKDSPILIKQVHPDIELVINPRNEGFARAANFALRRSEGKYVVFLNAIEVK